MPFLISEKTSEGIRTNADDLGDLSDKLLGNGTELMDAKLGDLSVQNADVTQNMHITGSLTVDGNIKGESIINAPQIKATEKLKATSQLVVQGLSFFEDDVDVDSNISIGSDLKVGGTSTLESDVSISGSATIESLSVNSDSTLNGDLSVSGETSLDSLSSGSATIESLTVNSDSTLNGDLSVSGATSLDSLSIDSATIESLTVNSDLTLNGDLSVSGATALNSLSSGAISTSDDVTVNGNVSASDSISAGGEISAGGDVTIGTITEATTTTSDTATGTLRVYDGIVVGANNSSGSYISNSGNIVALGNISLNGLIINSGISSLNNTNNNLFARIGLVDGYFSNNFNRPDIQQNQIRALTSGGRYAMFATQMPSDADPDTSSGLVASSWMSTFTLSSTVAAPPTPAYTFLQINSPPSFGQEINISYLEALNSASSGNGPNQDNIVFMGFASNNTPGASTYNIIANSYSMSVGDGGGSYSAENQGTAIMFAGYDQTPFLSSNGAPYGGGTAGQDTPYRWIPTCCVPFAPGATRKFVWMPYSNTTTYPDDSTIFPATMPSTEYLFQKKGIGEDNSGITYAYSGLADGSGDPNAVPQQSQYLDGGAWVEVTTAPTNVFPNIFATP